MPEISPYRVAVYAALAAVLLLVGWNSLRSGGGPESGRTAVAGSTTPSEPTGPFGSGLQVSPASRRIVVDVSGAVKRPGVYGFRHGERVIDAIRRAGGTTRDAVPGAINRAALLADGQQVVVPSGSAVTAAVGTGGEVAGAAEDVAADAPISLGTATQAQLEEIEGIGPVTAQSILEFRDSQGGISSIDELDQVSGIGPVTMEALRSRLQP